ncbi:MAG: SprB repeat-containing protein, partial [Sediminibacterium sp.]
MLYLFLKDSVLQQNNCANDSSGVIAVFAQGGYAPYSYSINGGAYQSNGVFVKLKSGIYNLSLKDSTGAVVTATDTIKSLSQTQIKTFVHSKNNDCFGGQIGAIIVDSVRGGVSPYSYTWSNGDTSSSGIFKLSMGEYSLKLKDFYGCKDSVFVSIKEGDKIVVTSTSTIPLCFNDCNGSILVSAKGGTGKLSYSWSNGSTLANITNLCSGTYKLTVKDSLSCMNNTEVVLSNPIQFKIDLVATATICLNQVYKTDIKDVNYPNANYSWTSTNGFVSSASSVSLNKAGTYFVNGSNLNGCNAKDTLVLNMQNSTIESVFAVATNIFQNDTIHIVNISMPRPDNSVWSYP